MRDCNIAKRGYWKFETLALLSDIGNIKTRHNERLQHWQIEMLDILDLGVLLTKIKNLKIRNTERLQHCQKRILENLEFSTLN